MPAEGVRCGRRKANLPASSRPISWSACAQRAAARALHHQCGGAEFHRQRAARGRRGSVDDASRRTRSARSWRAPTRCWSISAPSMRSGRRRRSRRIGVANKAGMPWVLDPVFIDRSRAARGFRQVAGRAEAARAAAQPRRVRRAGGRQDRRRRAGALCARHARPWSALTGERDLVSRRRAARDDRERPSADGAGHRDGLRGLGAGRRRASRSSPTPGRRRRRR